VGDQNQGRGDEHGVLRNTFGRSTFPSKHAQYVTDVQSAAEKAGVFDTPTEKLNGKNITAELSPPDALAAQVKAATS